MGFRFPASSPDATCGDEILFQFQTSSLILFRKQTNQPMSCTPLQCSGTGSDSLQRLLNDCGNWKSWERKLQFFFDSFLEAVSILHFPTLRCHVWFASSSAHNIFDIIFDLNLTKTAFGGYNPLTTQFTHLKCTTKWLLAYSESCDHLHKAVALVVKNLPANSGGLRVNPWVGKIPWRSKWQPTPVFLPGESHGQRSLAGYGPWGRKEPDRTEPTWQARTQQ